MKAYKSFVFNLLVISSFMAFPIYGNSVTYKKEIDSNLKKLELDTNLIDPDEHIYDIPFETKEEKFIEMFGEPTGYFRFSNTATAVLYGQTHLFFFYRHRLSGVRIGNPVILDLYVTNNLPTHMTFNKIGWSFDNGINENSNLQDIVDAYGDKLQGEIGTEGYTAFYKTHSTMVKFIFRRNPTANGETEAYIIDKLEIERLGPAEQPASP